MKNTLNDLNEFGLLQISGIDAAKLLQGQLTYDVSLITDKHSALAALCNPQGRVISLFYLTMIENDFYLLMRRDLIAITLNALKKYAVFFKVSMEDVSNHFAIFGCDTLINTPDINLKWIQTVDSSRYLLIADVNIAPSVSFTTLSMQEWKLKDITAGIPTIYPETSGKFLPHEICLDQLNAISFDKGCYTGQEIIARMHYRGKLKTRLYLAEIQSQTIPVPGVDIYIKNQTESVAGTLVDSAQKEYNYFYTLIMTTETEAKSDHLFLASDKNQYFYLLKTLSGNKE